MERLYKNAVRVWREQRTQSQDVDLTMVPAFKVNSLITWKKFCRYILVVLLLLVCNSIHNSPGFDLFDSSPKTRAVPQAPPPICGRAILATAWKPNAVASTHLTINPSCPEEDEVWNSSTITSTGKMSLLVETGVVDPDDDEKHDQNRITIAFLYYQSPTLLAQQLDTISQWPQHIRQYFQLLIIDDGSPAGWRVQDLLYDNGAAANRNIQDMITSMSLTVYRIEQDLHWNIGGARNLAMHLATTEYVLLMDIDVLIPASLAEFVVKIWNESKNNTITGDASDSHNKNDVIYIYFPRIADTTTSSKDHTNKPHPGVMFLSTATFWKIGGCDEDFVGHYGSTDPHLRYRAKYTPGIQLETVMAKNRTFMAEESLQSIVKNRNVCPISFTTCSGCNTNAVILPVASPPRVVSINKALFAKKQQGHIPWSNEYLRFSWKQINISESCSL